MNIHRFPDATAAAQACGGYILDRLREALASGGTATLAVSGGTSPQPMFEYFASSAFDWTHVHVFWVDERAVPPTDPQSNFKLAFETWLKPAGVPDGNIHRIQAERDPKEAAQRYREEIRKHFELPEGELPRFDVMHLGMGPDGHTASLFPGHPVLYNSREDDSRQLAAEVWVEKLHQWRITLLPAVLQAARHTGMLVVGADKAPILGAVLHGPYDPVKYPAQLARDAEWFLDEAAAAQLPR